jgi:hypothetical protein
MKSKNSQALSEVSNANAVAPAERIAPLSPERLKILSNYGYAILGKG